MDYRYVTALYRSHAAAELVRQELMAIGAAHGDIRVIPESEATAAAGERERISELQGLDLPESDLAEYERHVRQGDVLVSARLGEDLVAEAEEIMRRPGEFAHMHGDPFDRSRPSYRQEETMAGGLGEERGRDPFRDTEFRDTEPLREDRDTVLPTPLGGDRGQARRSD